jgi:hypothetical protein
MTKKIILNLLFSSSLLISITSCGQKTSPYIIDSAISKTVDENIKLTDFSPWGKGKSVETRNDTTLPENYGFGKNFGAMTQASLSHDTIFITSFLMARKASFGYKIILTSDSCTVKYFSLADEDIFKINKADKPSHLITMVCQTKKLTLLQKAQFKVGELIEGVVDLTTNDFWSFNDGQNTKVKTKLTGYFKTNLSQFRPDDKDIFKQIQ